MIGVALIVLCSTIASGVAQIANKDGKNDGGGIVREGLSLGGITVGGKGYSGNESTKKTESKMEAFGLSFLKRNSNGFSVFL